MCWRRRDGRAQCLFHTIRLVLGSECMQQGFEALWTKKALTEALGELNWLPLIHEQAAVSTAV